MEETSLAALGLTTSELATLESEFVRTIDDWYAFSCSDSISNDSEPAQSFLEKACELAERIAAIDPSFMGVTLLEMYNRLTSVRDNN